MEHKNLNIEAMFMRSAPCLVRGIIVSSCTTVETVDNLRVFPLEFCNGGSDLSIVMPLPDNGKSLTTCAFL